MARIRQFFSELFIAPITHHGVIRKCSLQMESTGKFCIQFSKVIFLTLIKTIENTKKQLSLKESCFFEMIIIIKVHQQCRLSLIGLIQ